MTYHLSQQKYVSKRCAAKRYGKSTRTIARWVENTKLKFPQPAIINGRWYFSDAELDEFDRCLSASRLRDLIDYRQAEAVVQRTQLAGGAT